MGLDTGFRRMRVDQRRKCLYRYLSLFIVIIFGFLVELMKRAKEEVISVAVWRRNRTKKGREREE